MTATRERYSDTVARLASAQKSNVGAPAYSRYINRPAGRHIAAVAYRLGLTPNGVTAISALFSLVGILLIGLIRPTWWLGLLVSLCLALGYAFDAADGQLARLRGGGSKSGEWLDHMVDVTKISSLHAAVGVSMFRFFHLRSDAFLLVPIGFLITANTMFFGMMLNDSLRREHAARTGRAVVRPAASSVRSLLVIPTDYGLLCVVFSILGATAAFQGVYTCLAAANIAFMLLAARKWFRDMSALD